MRIKILQNILPWDTYTYKCIYVLHVIIAYKQILGEGNFEIKPPYHRYGSNSVTVL